MGFYLSFIIGLISVCVFAIFWWLIVLDLENQANQEIFTHSKVKARKHKE